MEPKVDTHERVRELQPCEQREYERAIERRKDARAIAIGYLANPSIKLNEGSSPNDRQTDAREIVALADAMRAELEREIVKGGTDDPR